MECHIFSAQNTNHQRQTSRREKLKEGKCKNISLSICKFSDQYNLNAKQHRKPKAQAVADTDAECAVQADQCNSHQCGKSR